MKEEEKNEVMEAGERTERRARNTTKRKMVMMTTMAMATMTTFMLMERREWGAVVWRWYGRCGAAEEEAR
jgi:hypothetical protein